MSERPAATRDECPDCGCDRSQGKTRNCSGCVEDWPARSAATLRFWLAERLGWRWLYPKVRRPNV